MHLTMLLDMAVDGFGDRVVVGRRADGLTAAGLKALAMAGARLVLDAGADSVVYTDVNGPAFPVALFAAAYAGVPLVPLNYRLGAGQLDALLANHPQGYRIGPQNSAQFLADCAASPAEVDAPWSEDPAPAVLIYTSGTTSAPKGVRLGHENLTSYVFGTVEFAGAGEDDATLVSVPPYHIAAVANTITNLYAGRRSLVLEQFTGAQWLDLVRTEAVTNAMVVPTMLARILDEPDHTLDVPSLRALAYGGAAMPPRVIERALTRWPEVDFVNAYGLTETSSTIAVLSPEDHRDGTRLGSAGRAVPGVELAVRRDDGSFADPGERGRIVVRGPQVSADYAGSGSALDEQGWFDTRDDGWLDSEGYLFIGGRTDDTIIRGGENIAPAEIEDILLRHEAVADACVIGVPDEEWGQRLEAAVVLHPGTTAGEDQLRAWARQHLRSSKTPDRIHFVGELPRTETGKLLRRTVLSQLA